MPLGSVHDASASARARPKSASRRRPSSSKSRFAGLTSRCTRPRWWACASARAASRPTTSVCDGVSGAPRSRMLRRLPPPRYSVTRYGTTMPSAWSSPQSNTATMLGWLSALAARASARKRRRNASSSASASCSSLTATRRRSWVSTARKTRDDVPTPTGATSRYLPPSTRPVSSERRGDITAPWYRRLPPPPGTG